jgi:uncharacterized protein (DUF849 family)
LVAESEAQPLVVMCAPNGARLQKADHPGVPLTPDELADCAESLLPLGVSVIHLHVRDAQGGHSLDAGHYREALAAMRERVGDRIILQVTTESLDVYDRREQMQLVRELRPEAVSMALRELCPDERAEPEAGTFFRELGDMGVWPQYILYTAEETRRFDTLRRQGFFGEEHPFALAVLGRYRQSVEASEAGLEKLLHAVRIEDFPWAVCCIGHLEGHVARRAAELGGHLRVGFESNRQLPDGRVARDNADLLGAELRLVADSSASDRPIATANWVRRHLAGWKVEELTALDGTSRGREAPAES